MTLLMIGENAASKGRGIFRVTSVTIFGLLALLPSARTANVFEVAAVAASA